MRTLTATAVFAFSVAGIAAAAAADARVWSGGGATVGVYAGGVRAPQLVIYDSEPGVYVRSYWRAPWQNRHYFPATGKKPRVGRREHLSIRSHYKPAESYRRYWWTSSAFEPEPRYGFPPQVQGPLLK